LESAPAQPLFQQFEGEHKAMKPVIPSRPHFFIFIDACTGAEAQVSTGKKNKNNT
jgi:hypothetical protein